jgi:hypothetical protein
MRTLLIGALAAIVAGCSCLLPPQASMEGCGEAKGLACFDRTAASEPIEPRPALFNASTTTKKARSRTAKAEKPPSAANSNAVIHPDAKEADATTTTAKIEPPASIQPSEMSDPVIDKAKTTIAAELEEPASAEFVEMNRAVRKTMLGKYVDTICGRVRARNASGADTVDRLFLYLVDDDEAYVVDGATGSAAAITYRNICK